MLEKVDSTTLIAGSLKPAAKESCPLTGKCWSQCPALVFEAFNDGDGKQFVTGCYSFLS
jgi:hypothetical protein